MQFWIKKHDFQKYTFVKDNKRARQSLFSMNIHMSRSGCILIGVLMHTILSLSFIIFPVYCPFANICSLSSKVRMAQIVCLLRDTRRLSLGFS